MNLFIHKQIILWFIMFNLFQLIDSKELNQLQKQIALSCITSDGIIDSECVNRLKKETSKDEKISKTIEETPKDFLSRELLNNPSMKYHFVLIFF